MEITGIINNKRAAGTAAWAVYPLCTVIMGIMTYSSGWLWLVYVIRADLSHLFSKASAGLQPVFMMMFSFIAKMDDGR